MDVPEELRWIQDGMIGKGIWGVREGQEGQNEMRVGKQCSFRKEWAHGANGEGEWFMKVDEGTRGTCWTVELD